MDRIFIYEIIHLSAIMLIFISLGARLTETLLLKGTNKKSQIKRWVAITHGLGMVFALLGGFGMLARLNISYPYPGWVWAKLVIWLILGGMLGVIPRTPKFAKPYWFILVALGALAASMAILKPF